MPLCLDCCRKMNREGCAKCPAGPVPLYLKVGEQVAKVHKANREWLEKQAWHNEAVSAAKSEAEKMRQHEIQKKRDARRRKAELRNLSRQALEATLRAKENSNA